MRFPNIIAKVLVALAIAFFIVILGENDWMESLGRIGFYFDMLVTIFSVWIVLEYTDRVTGYLDTMYPWRSTLFLRSILQTGAAIIIPALLSILITFLQWELIYDQSLVTHGYFAYEFPVTLLLILIVNLFFVIMYLLRPTARENQDIRIEEVPGAPQTLLGRKGNRTIPVDIQDISMLTLRSGVPFLTTFDSNEMTLPENMDHYEKLLPSGYFFRANRQIIIHKRACSSFKAIENGKIEIQTVPSKAQPVIVSQKRAANFRVWINS